MKCDLLKFKPDQIPVMGLKGRMGKKSHYQLRSYLHFIPPGEGKSLFFIDVT